MATKQTPGPNGPDHHEDDEHEKRRRLMAAILDVYPADKTYDYGERYHHYQEVLSKGSDTPLGALKGIFTARWALAMRRWRKLLDENLRREGHSRVRWQILFELSQPHLKHTLTSLASRVDVLSAALVGILDELEKDSLIVRTVDANDRRSKRLTLTPQGEATMYALTEFTMELREEFLEDVSEGEMKLIMDVVERMNKNLDRMHYLR